MTSLEPALPPEHRKTYQIKAPVRTHWRTATCDEVDCRHYREGWLTVVDETTELGQKQAHFIRHDTTRRHHESRGYEFPHDELGEHTIAPNLTVFRFEPESPCFQAHEHRVPTGRPELYVVRGGDHRGNPRQEFRQHTGPDDWVDDFATHQDRIADAIQRG